MKMQMLLKVMAQQFRVSVYLLSINCMQGSVWSYSILWKISDSLEGEQVTNGGKKRETEREKDRRAASPTVSLALEAWVHMSALPCTV